MPATNAVAYVAEKRRGAAAKTAYHLEQMLLHLRAAQHYNNMHDLELELPGQSPLVELIGACMQISSENRT